MQNWKNIGPVTVRSFNGNVREFDCLEEAVAHFTPTIIDRLKGNPLAGWDTSYRKDKNDFSYASSWDASKWGWIVPDYNGDSHTFHDDLGMRIPVWKIKEVSSMIDRSVSKYTRFRRHVDEERDFRRVPVPGIGHYKHWRGTWYRIPSHLPQLRSQASFDTLFEDSDLDVPERFKAKVKKKGEVMTGWDDIPKDRTRSWKAFRRTQHK